MRRPAPAPIPDAPATDVPAVAGPTCFAMRAAPLLPPVVVPIIVVRSQLWCTLGPILSVPPELLLRGLGFGERCRLPWRCGRNTGYCRAVELLRGLPAGPCWPAEPQPAGGSPEKAHQEPRQEDPQGARRQSASHHRQHPSRWRGQDAAQAQGHCQPGQLDRGRLQGADRRRAARYDRRAQAAATRTASPSTTCCRRRSPRSARLPPGSWGSGTSTSSSWAAPRCTWATSRR